MPCGFSKDGLPIGLQLVGPAFHEPVLLSIATPTSSPPIGIGANRPYCRGDSRSYPQSESASIPRGWRYDSCRPRFKRLCSEEQDRRSGSARARPGQFAFEPGAPAHFLGSRDPNHGWSASRPDSGFVLKAEKFDEKTVIHDYGFGGAGMSLAWGCGAMVSDIALEHGERRAAVLGCGSPGLTAARQLQRRGFEVTIYTMAVPPYTTSNMSWAGFTPTSGLVSGAPRTGTRSSGRRRRFRTGSCSSWLAIPVTVSTGSRATTLPIMIRALQAADGLGMKRRGRRRSAPRRSCGPSATRGARPGRT